MKFLRCCAALSLALLCSAPVVQASIFAPSYSASVTFADQLDSTSMTLAFDGTSYWSSSGGSSGGVRLAQYDSAGAPVGTYAPGLDFRSVFTSGTTVYARQYNDNTIFSQTSPGVFAPTGTVLAGPLDDQSSVTLNHLGTGYIAKQSLIAGVEKYDLSGNFLGTDPLTGYGSMFGEGVYPQDRGAVMAPGAPYYLTYSNGDLSAWDLTGTRIDTTTLIGAGTSFDSHFSLSFANGLLWIVDGPGGLWRGYDIGLGAVAPGGDVPEPAAILAWSLLTATGAVAAVRIKRRRA
jgi:hypothetical protein